MSYSDDKKPKRLRNLKLNRVDLVTAGANPGAHVALFKAEGSDIVSNEVEIVEAPDAPVEEVAMSEETPVETADVVAKADFEALQKSLEDARSEITKMQRERKQAEFIAKAAEFDNLGKSDELGAMLLEASEGMSEAAYQTLERTLKAANAQVDKGALFAQFSRPEGDSPEVGDRILALAKAKVEAGQAKTLEIAKLQVMQENPVLQSEYVAARSGR